MCAARGPDSGARGCGSRREALCCCTAPSNDVSPMRFEGTDTYVATDDLMMAVNAAVTLQRPLLVKGEPGTGKTLLAREVARSLKRPFQEWYVKSTTKAQ